MAIEAKTKVIGAHTYTVRTLGAITARGVFVRLVKTVGGALAGGTATGALVKVLESVSESDLAYFCDVFAAQTTVAAQGKAGATVQQPLASIFDLHFAGRMLDMFQWLKFSVESNYPDVFLALASAVQREEANVTAEESAS
jgi:GTP-dependent phosphoenolpyruvate carboxykinase